MREIVEGLGGKERERVAALREQGHFFWIDLCVDGLSQDDRQAMDLPEHALRPLLDFDRGERPSRRFSANRR